MCIVVAFHRYLGSDFFIYSGFSQIGLKQTWQYSWWHYRDTPENVNKFSQNSYFIFLRKTTSFDMIRCACHDFRTKIKINKSKRGQTSSYITKKIPSILNDVHFCPP